MGVIPWNEVRREETVTGEGSLGGGRAEGLRGAHTTENGKESHQGSEPDRKEEKIRWIDGNVSVIKFVFRNTCLIL